LPLVGAHSGILRRAGAPAALDLLLAAALTIGGGIELLLGPADGDARLVRAVALLAATVSLAWRREAPLLPLAVVAVGLPVQASAGNFFDAHPVTVLLVMVIALYSAGRHLTGGTALAFAGVAAATLAATRIAFDPDAGEPLPAAMTVVAVALPFLVGHWAQGQGRLHRELEAKAMRRERQRERDARDAAEEERMRIAADLQAAVADRLGESVRQAGALQERLAARDHAGARELLSSIATSSREALADVRRVLGILRRDGQAPRLAPPALPAAAAPLAPAGDDPAPGGSRSRPRAGTRPSRPTGRPGGGRRRPGRSPLVLVLLAGAEFELLLMFTGGSAPSRRSARWRSSRRCCGAAATPCPSRSPCSPPWRSRVPCCAPTPSRPGTPSR
jgi:signal transduction histidine kinase